MEFDAKFVNFMWKDELYEEKAFFSNDIDQLKHYVEFNDTDRMGSVQFSFDKSNPFKIKGKDGRNFKFVYFDPHYELKRAFEKGEKIEVDLFNNGKWTVITDPTWDNEPERYRIKKNEEPCWEEKPKTKLVTNRAFSQWLMLGNGEYLTPDFEVSTFWTYDRGAEDEYVDSSVMIRKWGENQWRSLIEDNLYN